MSVGSLHCHMTPKQCKVAGLGSFGVAFACPLESGCIMWKVDVQGPVRCTVITALALALTWCIGQTRCCAVSCIHKWAQGRGVITWLYMCSVSAKTGPCGRVRLQTKSGCQRFAVRPCMLRLCRALTVDCDHQCGAVAVWCAACTMHPLLLRKRPD